MRAPVGERVTWWSHVRSGEPEGDGQGPVEPCELGRSEPSPSPGEHGGGQGDDGVAVGGRVVLQAFVRSVRNLGDVAAEAAADEDTDHGAHGGDGAVPSGDAAEVATGAGAHDVWRRVGLFR